MTNSIYKSQAWKRARRACLARDQFRCQLRLRGCLIRATCVDHIIELAERPPFGPYDLRNLQAACAPCNSRKHASTVKRVMAEHGGTVRRW
jgi:5-methylcytosine-specific restriction endonuclease McrA